MTTQRILLTGDDGYNSIGTRLLIRALSEKHHLQIAATKNQQSGVGGMLTLRGGCDFGTDVVDGIPALWVDGTPADVMEMAQGYFTEPFDVVISGVNLGANVTSAVISSGTVSAAVRGMGVGVGKKAIAISWDAPPEFWHKKHDASEDISEYFEYPGNVLKPLIEMILREDLWGVSLININLPQAPTRKIRFTKILKDVTQYYSYPLTIDREKNHFSYDRDLFNVQATDLKYDAAAVTQGYISITPCAVDMTHFTTFEKLQPLELTLE